MITDKLRSYGAAKRDLVPGLEHRSHKGLNNPAEVSHKPDDGQSPFILLSTTISTKNDTFIHEIISSLIAPLLSPNGGCFVPLKYRRITGN
jgi:transposase-like protein